VWWWFYGGAAWANVSASRSHAIQRLERYLRVSNRDASHVEEAVDYMTVETFAGKSRSNPCLACLKISLHT
jgi:hypothetical protein